MNLKLSTLLKWWSGGWGLLKLSNPLKSILKSSADQRIEIPLPSDGLGENGRQSWEVGPKIGWIYFWPPKVVWLDWKGWGIKRPKNKNRWTNVGDTKKNRWLRFFFFLALNVWRTILFLAAARNQMLIQMADDPIIGRSSDDSMN